MTEQPRRIRDRELHEMSRAGSLWRCTARNPRCAFVAHDLPTALAHAVANQADRREETPIPGIVAPTEDAA